MQLKYSTLLCIFCLFLSQAHAQVGISTDGSTPHSSAMFEVKSTDKGVLLPRLTQAQRNAITSPATGLMIFQTDNTSGFYYYNGTEWESFKNSVDNQHLIAQNSIADAPSDVIVTSEIENDLALINAGYTLVGRTTSPFETYGTLLSNTWVATSLANAPIQRTRHSAVWTGSEMIIWGGAMNSNLVALTAGAKFNPTTNAWTNISNINAPQGRFDHTAIWTGAEMIIWGGIIDGSNPGTGGKYNPITDTWMSTNLTNAPTARFAQTTIWTGTEMIVWGGATIKQSNTMPFKNGGKYNPVTDSWTSINETSAPSARRYHTAIWTGTEMIVWGGVIGSCCNFANTGSRYNPTTDTWSPIYATNAPSGRYDHTAIWTGTEMIIWGGGSNGGNLNTGGKYNPNLDAWTATSLTSAPSGRFDHKSVWTGTEMVIWGGGNNLNNGGKYNPITDSWVATPASGAPQGRKNHTVVWTGTEMIVWGGGGYFNTGGKLTFNGAVGYTATTKTLYHYKKN